MSGLKPSAFVKISLPQRCCVAALATDNNSLRKTGRFNVSRLFGAAKIDGCHAKEIITVTIWHRGRSELNRKPCERTK